ncbi:MAG: hypothetical protein PHE79_05665 [Eubacteriales bacterium]|nr:hypothetical protein [Eubacteriales bacterium]
MTYDVEIIQTIKILKRVTAQNVQDAIIKGNRIISDDEIPIEQYELVDASVKAKKTDTDNVIPMEARNKYKNNYRSGT